MKRNEKTDVSLFFAGTAIGAASAVLLTPYTGRKARRLIRRKTMHSRDYLSDAGGYLASKGQKAYRDCKKLAGKKLHF